MILDFQGYALWYVSQKKVKQISNKNKKYRVDFHKK